MRKSSAKRLLDIGISSLSLFVLAPVLFVLAALIRREDGGPAFFRQPRVGQHGQVFVMLKLRSMKAVPSDGYALDTSEWYAGVPDDFVFKAASSADLRLTAMGAFLRRSSLDELPQLVNILRGEMSLVGPRPEILPIAERYNARQQVRLTVKPGLTGWAQVNGRAERNHGAKIDADLYYVQNRSLRLDLTILLRTVLTAIAGHGAY